jgi:hypothetical protein
MTISTPHRHLPLIISPTKDIVYELNFRGLDRYVARMAKRLRGCAHLGHACGTATGVSSNT